MHLLCSGWPGAAAKETVDGIRVHRVGSRYGFAAGGAGAFRRLAGDVRPDVVVEDVNKIPLYLPLFWRRPFVLLVPHLFGATSFREMPAPVAALVWASEKPMPRIYGKAGVHAISQATRDDLVARGFQGDRIQVILPGVDTGRYRVDSTIRRSDVPTFLYVGRLKRYKQVDTAIAALAIVRRTVPQARLTIAGTGDDRDRLERVAREAGLAGAVDFPGFVSEERKIELYRQAWAVVMPSLKEGWGITNIEAAACGTPVIAADNSALRESVRDGRTGFLVPTHDVAAWAGAMRRVTEASERERLSGGARAFGASFSWERTASETFSHLDAVAGAWPGGQEN